MSSVTKEANENSGLGNITTFVEAIGADSDKVYATKASKVDMERLHHAQESLDKKARGELAAAGVQLDEVPTRQDAGAQITPVDQKQRGSGKG